MQSIFNAQHVCVSGFLQLVYLLQDPQSFSSAFSLKVLLFHFIYLFLAGGGLHCHAQASLVASCMLSYLCAVLVP